MNDNTLRNQTQTSHDWIKKLLADSGDVIQRRLISAFDVSEMIDQVSSQLETHFVEEEQDGGLFDTIAEQAPRLVHHVEQLRLQGRHRIVRVHHLCAGPLRCAAGVREFF